MWSWGTKHTNKECARAADPRAKQHELELELELGFSLRPRPTTRPLDCNKKTGNEYTRIVMCVVYVGHELASIDVHSSETKQPPIVSLGYTFVRVVSLKQQQRVLYRDYPRVQHNFSNDTPFVPRRELFPVRKESTRALNQAMPLVPRYGFLPLYVQHAPAHLLAITERGCS